MLSPVLGSHVNKSCLWTRKEKDVNWRLLDPFLCKRRGSSKLSACLAARLEQIGSSGVTIVIKMLYDMHGLTVEGMQICVLITELPDPEPKFRDCR